MKAIKNKYQSALKALLTGIFLISLSSSAVYPAADGSWLKVIKVIGLQGKWRFSPGDRSEWSKPDFKDNNWEGVKVPSAWEDQNFYGYDGYAWYRKHFYCPSEAKGRDITLELGYIDDVDEVYVNGHLVGSTGAFPPGYFTAYNAYRKYNVPDEYLNINGDNVIAVRVYDAELSGGIISGMQQIVIHRYALEPDYNISGQWKFQTGDDIRRKDIKYDDSRWDKINVPGPWENQGYADLDGYAWYRKNIYIASSLLDKDLVLMLGNIDDKDEVYLNGRKIGATGNMNEEWANSHDYKKLRGYFIPGGLLRAGENVVAVRVFDGGYVGGIYAGPVGFVSRQKYTSFFKSYKDRSSRSIWDILMGN